MSSDQDAESVRTPNLFPDLLVEDTSGVSHFVSWSLVEGIDPIYAGEGDEAIIGFGFRLRGHGGDSAARIAFDVAPAEAARFFQLIAIEAANRQRRLIRRFDSVGPSPVARRRVDGLRPGLEFVDLEDVEGVTWLLNPLQIAYLRRYKEGEEEACEVFLTTRRSIKISAKAALELAFHLRGMAREDCKA